MRLSILWFRHSSIKSPPMPRLAINVADVRRKSCAVQRLLDSSKAAVALVRPRSLRCGTRWRSLSCSPSALTSIGPLPLALGKTQGRAVPASRLPSRHRNCAAANALRWIVWSRWFFVFGKYHVLRSRSTNPSLEPERSVQPATPSPVPTATTAAAAAWKSAQALPMALLSLSKAFALAASSDAISPARLPGLREPTAARRRGLRIRLPPYSAGADPAHRARGCTVFFGTSLNGRSMPVRGSLGIPSTRSAMMLR